MTSDATTAPADVAPPGRAARAAWIVGGLAAVGLGGLGVIVPGLPTTVFFLIAAWCFSRSSPRLEAWVLGLPKVGPMVRDHRAGLGMPRRAKVVACSMMWGAILLSSWVLRDVPLAVAGVVALGAVGTATIVWRVPLRERVLAERAATPAATPTTTAGSTGTTTSRPGPSPLG